MYNLIISNQHVYLTDALKNKIKNEFKKHHDKFGNFIHGNVNVTIKVDNGEHVVECFFHSKKQQFFASHTSHDMYSSIEKTFQEAFRQVKKRKDIINNTKNKNKRLQLAEVAA